MFCLQYNEKKKVKIITKCNRSNIYKFVGKETQV